MTHVHRDRIVRFCLVLALLAGLAACSESSHTATTISAKELEQRIEAGKAPLILDVRTPGEYAAGHIPGAINIPHDQLASRLSELPASHDEEIVVHCKSGRRAAMAESVLAQAGYHDVRDLEGHMDGWKASGLPVE